MRIMVLDGAMGTMIQRHDLDENDFRGDLPIAEGVRVKGCNDLLSLTRPDIIERIHREYIVAGADIIETNSFNSNPISLSDYMLEDLTEAINHAAASLARRIADEEGERLGRAILVAGSMGPSNVALSIMSDNSSDIDFDMMRNAFRRQALALMKGGVDLILLETIFDTMNAKAAIAGYEDALDEFNDLQSREGIETRRIRLMISVTLTEQGRTLSGQTIEAFLASIAHSRPFSIGINCGFGAKAMEPWLKHLQRVNTLISIHPNAGLPDELGCYSETPQNMAETLGRFMSRGWINIVGGCCGTTPLHIAAIAVEAKKHNARAIPEKDSIPLSRVSGIEELTIGRPGDFIKVGERCNVAGSRKFLRLISEGKSTEGVGIAVDQVKKGAEILDINMDDGLLDAPEEMRRFVELLSADKDVSPLPLMIDSSDETVIMEALKRIQGKPIVNSISLKNGEEEFLKTAKAIRRMGGMCVVMAFDEKGQATDLERRKEICQRAYELLIEKAGFKGEEIIFDPNILTIATGMREHDRYALDFLDSITWIKKNLPGAKVSGGVSNLSFAFRGHNKIREAIHTVFLHHAIQRGMDMAIVNPSTSTHISDIDPTLRDIVEDLLFCRSDDAADRLMAIAVKIKQEDECKKKSAHKPNSSTTENNFAKSGSQSGISLKEMIEKGIDNNLQQTLEEEMQIMGSAMAVVSSSLMSAMQNVGDEFAEGRVFLPQVVRSASVMKKAINYLSPFIALEREDELQDKRGIGGIPFVLATVKGDVHDIGKNIVAIILKCSGFDIIDLGVMAEGEKIIEAVKTYDAKFVGLSGLITPSLTEMANVASLLEREGLKDVALFVGGATTSDLHTALKIAPLFSGVTAHTRDAAILPVVASRLADKSTRDDEIRRIENDYAELRRVYAQRKRNESPDFKRESLNHKSEFSMPQPIKRGIVDFEYDIEDVRDLINWREFLHVWRLHPSNAENPDDESRRLLNDARRLLDHLGNAGVKVKGRVIVSQASGHENKIVLIEQNVQADIDTPLIGKRDYSMADFVAEKDWVGAFVVTAGDVAAYGINNHFNQDDYLWILIQSLADRLAEAATEKIHNDTLSKIWGLSGRKQGIRPAIGYPSIPNQLLVFELDKILHYSDLGISLTENGALSPSSTTTGLIIANPDARY